MEAKQGLKTLNAMHVKIETNAFILNLGTFPEEVIQHILSYLKYENIEELKLVNRKFKSSCNIILKKGFDYAKQEVVLRSERAADGLTNCTSLTTSRQYLAYTQRIFWFVVREFLSNRFCLFDILEGYSKLKAAYSVNGKTIDVVMRILRLKEEKDPLHFLVNATIGNENLSCSNFNCLRSFEEIFLRWLSIKYNGTRISNIYVPLFDKRQPGLNLPTYYPHLKKQIHAMVLDNLTTLWTQVEKSDSEKPRKRRALRGEFKCPYLQNAFKPGLHPDLQLYPDSDSDYSQSDFSDSESSSDE